MWLIEKYEPFASGLDLKPRQIAALIVAESAIIVPKPTYGDVRSAHTPSSRSYDQSVRLRLFPRAEQSRPRL